MCPIPYLVHCITYCECARQWYNVLVMFPLSSAVSLFCGDCSVGMGVTDIFRSRQLSSKSFLQKSCQGNCQVNCTTKKFLQGNCQVNSVSANFVKAIVKSIALPKYSSRQLSSQLFGENLFNFLCQLLWILGRFWSVMVILVNYGQLKVILLYWVVVFWWLLVYFWWIYGQLFVNS